MTNHDHSTSNAVHPPDNERCPGWCQFCFDGNDHGTQSGDPTTNLRAATLWTPRGERR